MAKKIMGYIKLQLPAGKATPQPPVGPALGQYGVSIPNFTKEFNVPTRMQAVTAGTVWRMTSSVQEAPMPPPIIP